MVGSDDDDCVIPSVYVVERVKDATEPSINYRYLAGELRSDEVEFALGEFGETLTNTAIVVPERQFRVTRILVSAHRGIRFGPVKRLMDVKTVHIGEPLV